MLKAALVGFGSSGKTTLFQLMTSARETGRAAHGKGEATIGISKVPETRLHRLTSMYNPRKRVPATVEFSDLAAPGGTTGAQTLVDVAGYKNAETLVHVGRAFSGPGVCAPCGGRHPAGGCGVSRGQTDSRGPRLRGAPPRADRKGSQEE